MNDKETKIIKRLEDIIYEGVSNEFLVQLIECGGDFLNLMTIPKYANLNKLSYNGVKNNREVRTIRGVKFVIDND